MLREVWLGDMLCEDDEYTGSHSRGVVVLALEIADELRIGDDSGYPDGLRGDEISLAARVVEVALVVLGREAPIEISKTKAGDPA